MLLQNARVSHVVSTDLRRKICTLETECQEVKGELSCKTQEAAELRQRNQQLIGASFFALSYLIAFAILSYVFELLILADVYNFTDEADSLPDDNEALLECLNASIDNFPIRDLENLNFEELRLKYEALICEHRSMISSSNTF